VHNLPADGGSQAAIEELEVALLRARQELRVITAVTGGSTTRAMRRHLDDALGALHTVKAAS
jgi:hypothetical protein